MTVRVRKARYPARRACGHYVPRGQLEVNRGGGWLCLDCALAAIRAANNVPATRGGAAQEGTT
jgi:hypothetical protein